MLNKDVEQENYNDSLNEDQDQLKELPRKNSNKEAIISDDVDLQERKSEEKNSDKNPPKKPQ